MPTAQLISSQWHKQCPKCNTEFVRASFDELRLDFRKDSQRKDGLTSYCKSCRAILMRIQDIKKYKNKKYGSILARTRHPEKYKARMEVNNALARGLLSKPDRCTVCNIKTKLHGHHDDYSQPLKVKWVCVKCHGDIHARN